VCGVCNNQPTIPSTPPHPHPSHLSQLHQLHHHTIQAVAIMALGMVVSDTGRSLPVSGYVTVRQGRSVGSLRSPTPRCHCRLLSSLHCPLNTVIGHTTTPGSYRRRWLQVIQNAVATLLYDRFGGYQAAVAVAVVAFNRLRLSIQLAMIVADVQTLPWHCCRYRQLL